MGLPKIVEKPAFMTFTVRHIPDLIIVGSEYKFKSKGIIDQIADHDIPYCYLSTTTPKLESYKREIWRYNLGRYNELRRLLAIMDLNSTVEKMRTSSTL